VEAFIRVRWASRSSANDMSGSFTVFFP